MKLFLMLCIFAPAAVSTATIPLRARPNLQRFAGVVVALAASIAGLWTAACTLVTGDILTFHAGWTMPAGSFSLSLDGLSAVFLIPLFILSAAGAVYALEYMKESASGRNQGFAWAYYNILVSSMALVVTASNGFLFLIAWEIMSVSSFACVLHNHEQTESREAAWIYLVATHIGTAFLLVFFLFAGARCGSLDFSAFARHGFSPHASSFLFIAGLVGFGSKAGFVPFHVWLPRAHPVAPSHVSALMSGIMIKMGIYGLMRSMVMLGHFQPWWGYLLVSIGCVSGIAGVLLALGQHDLKRLLAYHSVENIGIIALGVGAGALGVSYGIPSLAVLGFCGALLHVVNHALFKGLLFLSAGSVLHAAKTARIDALGGLIKKMPATAMGFLVGSIAICGLPPLNGFISEFLVYLAGFTGLSSSSVPVFGMSAALVGSLALIGGLAAACFTKAFGTVFLGEPRSNTKSPRESGPFMRAPMYGLGAICLIIGLFFGPLSHFLAVPAGLLASVPSAQAAHEIFRVTPSLAGISYGSMLLAAAVAALFLARKALLSKRPVTTSSTWGCGYGAPTPRMQYTASSFAQPVISFFGRVLGVKPDESGPESPFPAPWKFHSHVPDLFLDNVYIPAFKAVDKGLSRLRWLQGGKVHRYVLYIAVTLIALLMWNVLWPN